MSGEKNNSFVGVEIETVVASEEIKIIKNTVERNKNSHCLGRKERLLLTEEKQSLFFGDNQK